MCKKGRNFKVKNFKKVNKGDTSKKKKRALATASGLALIALLSGTFAWLTAQDQRVNRLESLAVSDGSVAVNETFDPTPIQAGAEATKKVTITNGGSTPVFVRASFEEVLKHLKKDAEETTRTTKWVEPTPAAGSTAVTAAQKAGIGVDLPVEFSDTNYTKWTDISSKITLDGTTATLDSKGVKVMARGFYKLDAATNKPVQEFEYVMYAPLTTGKNQKVTGDLVIKDYNVPGSGLTTADTGITNWKYDITSSSIKYYVYEDGYDVNTVNWAKSVLSNDPSDPSKTPTGAALLGTKGTRYGKDFDYRSQADGGIIPTVNLTPKLLGNSSTTPAVPLYPTPTNPTNAIQADNKGKITLEYNKTNILDPAPTDTSTKFDVNKWVYNPEDGWFYYTGYVATGAFTTSFLEKVKYDSSIGTEYSNATYDLVVKMEAVQADKQALTDTTAGGFGLDASKPVSKKLIDAMSTSLPGATKAP